MTDIEKRGGALGVEFRSESDKRTLTGYAVVWNSDTTIGDYFVERIAPGAFTKALRGDILALVNHDTGRVVGRTRSGTLRLAEDSHGLKVTSTFRTRPTATTFGRWLSAAMSAA